MIVACGRCNTKYKIPADKISSGGVRVRCSKCKHVFLIKEDGGIEIVSAPSSPSSKPALEAKDSGLLQDVHSAKTREVSFATKQGKPSATVDHKLQEAPPPLPPLPKRQVNTSPPGKTRPPLKSTGSPQDPFAGFDLDDDGSLDKPPKIGGAPGSGLTGPPSGKDIFNSLPDPFAGLETPSAESAAMKGVAKETSDPSLSPAPEDSPMGSDPFFGIGESSFEKLRTGAEPDHNEGTPSAQMVFPGNDGFVQFEPSGLELEGEQNRGAGHLDVAQADPFQKKAASLPAASRDNQLPEVAMKPIIPSRQKEARSELVETKSGLWQLGFWVFLLAVGLLLFVVYRSEGKPDFFSWSTYVKAFTGESASNQSTDELKLVQVSSTTYTNRLGHKIALVWGKVLNLTHEKKTNVLVQGKMLDEKGLVLNRAVAPAGVFFTPLEVYQMEDRRMIMAAYHSKLPEGPGFQMGPSESIPFMLVFHECPSRLNEVRFACSLVESEKPLREVFFTESMGLDTE